jgi:hypothetical protein
MMTKQELKAATNSELITDYIKSYSRLVLAQNFGGAWKALDKHLNHLNAEMLSRELLTQDQIDYLNM